MAGNVKEQRLVRQLPLGTASWDAVQAAMFEDVRLDLLALARRMVAVAWQPAPLIAGDIDGECLFALQRQAVAGGIKSVYAERMRLIVFEALKAGRNRYFRWLFGRLRHVAQKLERTGEDGRLYLCVPPDTAIGEDQLKALAKVGGFDSNRLVGLFRLVRSLPATIPSLVAEGIALGAGEMAVLREMLAQVDAKYRPPEFGDDSAVTLPMDPPRWLKGGSVGFAETQANLIGSAQSDGFVRDVIAITHPRLKNRHVEVPLIAVGAAAKRLLSGHETLGSPVMILKPGAVEFRLNVKREAVADFSTVDAILGGDPGMRNTMAVSVVKADGQTAKGRLATVASFDKAKALAYLEGHVSDGAGKLAERLFSGKKFLASVARLACRIDDLKSLIDREYKLIADEVARLRAALGLAEGEEIGWHHAAGAHAEIVAEFFQRLQRLQPLKGMVRDLFRRIEHLKKCWFGFIANRMMAMATAHNAGVVVEDSTWVAIPTDDPRYKGRTFNRVMNQGGRGRLVRLIGAKAAWLGIPFATIASWYSSQTCFDSGTVAKSQRKGKTFKSAATGAKSDSDLHAAEMFARYLTLIPKCDTDTWGVEAQEATAFTR